MCLPIHRVKIKSIQLKRLLNQSCRSVSGKNLLNENELKLNLKNIIRWMMRMN